MTRSSVGIATLSVVLLTLQPALSQMVVPPIPLPIPEDAPAVNPRGDGGTNVRQTQYLRNDGVTLRGVVESVEVGKLVIVGSRAMGDFEPVFARYTLHPIDVLAAGYSLPGVALYDSYLWEDIKVKDTVEVFVKEDKEERKRYVCSVCIDRRPGDKLPLNKGMKWTTGYCQRNILNDIENGLDVSEEAIREAFPPFIYTSPGQPPRLMRPGGLPEKYRKLLITVRGEIAMAEDKKRKEAELKAKPPEKKEK